MNQLCFSRNFWRRATKVRRALREVVRSEGVACSVVLSHDWPMAAEERELRGQKPQRHDQARLPGLGDAPVWRGARYQGWLKAQRQELMASGGGLLGARQHTHRQAFQHPGFRRVLAELFPQGIRWERDVSWLEPMGAGRWAPSPHTHLVGALAPEVSVDEARTKIFAAWKKVCGWNHRAKCMVSELWCENQEDEEQTVSSFGSYLAKQQSITPAYSRHTGEVGGSVRAEWKPRATDLPALLDDRSVLELVYWWDRAGKGLRTCGWIGRPRRKTSGTPTTKRRRLNQNHRAPGRTVVASPWSGQPGP